MRSYVTYSDFGAKGDGITDDFRAFVRTHEYANENALPVKAEAGKTYLLHDSLWDGEIHSVSIKTDTDWTGATIINDDSDIGGKNPENDKRYLADLFKIENYHPTVLVADEYLEAINATGGIKAGKTKKIDTGLGYPAMLIIFNEEKKHFIRYGGNEDSGAAEKELVIVDKDGNIDPTTPMLFDFEKVTSIRAYRIDIPTLTLEGGTFITRSCRINMWPSWAYMNRGFGIVRPHTHIKNLVHKIEGELDKFEPVYEDENGVSYSATPDGYTYRDGKIYGEDGAEYTGDDVKPFAGECYNGFINAYNTHDVELDNVTLQSRIYYLQGTYDLGGNTVNMLVCKNCNQSNFYAGDPDYPLMPTFGKWWGVAGTSYCKNMIYENCNLTRYDAHKGVVNGRISNCRIGSIRLTGGGDMTIENSQLYFWYDSSPISMREDYGSTWRGTVTVRDSEFVSVRGDCKLDSLIVMRSPNWYFGYDTYSPNIIIDNVKIQNVGKEIALYSTEDLKWNGFYYRSVNDENLAIKDTSYEDGSKNLNPYNPPSFIKIINNENNGYEIYVPDVPFLKNTEVTGAKRVK